MEIPFNCGDEYDALTWTKGYFNYRPGVRKSIKNRYRRRARKASKSEIKLEVNAHFSGV